MEIFSFSDKMEGNADWKTFTKSTCEWRENMMYCVLVDDC